MASVLIVDDEEPIREAINLLLEDEGFACLHAANGEQALQVLRANTDRMIVLLDQMMPHMTGKDVLDAVAADPSLSGRHVFILLTAADKTLPLALVQRMQQMNVRLVGKPFDIDRLLGVVQQMAQQLGDHAPTTSGK